MCGISGYYSEKKLSKELSSSLRAIAHRGPDGAGENEWKFADLHAGLGHVRLSVLDLSSSGAQPMISANGQIAMVFNGEIYNHGELRQQMSGHMFRGHSDSEVLLEYYALFGTSCFASLRGMFAAAFLELKTGTLVLVRDQIGIKPLYYSRVERTVSFSSEIRGLRPFFTQPPRVCPDALFEFLNCGFVYEPETGLRGIQKVPSGCYVRVAGDSVETHRYFSFEASTRTSSFTEMLVPAAIERQLEADVKLGVFFSGGVDSSVIAACAQKPALFLQYPEEASRTSGMESDSPYAKAISENLNIDLFVEQLEQESMDADAILASMRAVAEGTEELISDYTYLASAQLSASARKRGFKVMLSGMGGDEVFLGYPRYRPLLHRYAYSALGLIAQNQFVRRLARRVPRIAKKIDRFTAFASEQEFPIRYARLLGYFAREEIETLIGPDVYASSVQRFLQRSQELLRGFENDPEIIQALALDFNGFLSHNLSVTDKSSMTNGLEVRVPLLDQDLYCAYLGSIRSGSVQAKYGKSPLRKLLSRRLRPELHARRKVGFNPPLDGKIEAIGRARVAQVLCSGPLREHINIDAALRTVDLHFSRKANNTYKIWQLLYLSMWLESNAPAALASYH